MGRSAGLFFATDSQNTLDWRIRPSDDQYDQQMERWNDLAGHLIEDLSERSGYPMRSWLQGSYKFGTQVRPSKTGQEFDIDLGLYFVWPGTAADGNHGPKALKDMVRDSLLAYAAEEDNEAGDVADAKALCERLHFKPDFHIDVPCYHLAANADERWLASDDDHWKESDPKAIYRWWTKTFETMDLPRLRRVVRYLKMWTALKFEDAERPSSILLTVITGEAWAGLDRNSLSGDDEHFKAVVMAICDRFEDGSSVPNPVATGENLNRLSAQQNDVMRERFADLLAIAERAIAAPAKGEAGEIWGEAFEHFFPLPDTEEGEAAVAQGTALIPIRFDPQIAVEARPKKQAGRVLRGENGIGPIPKGCTIKFVLVNASSLPPGAEVTWTVRNQGQDAEDINDLGHRWSHRTEVEENSAYRGTQYMDVSVRLAGNLIGRRRVPVKISGFALPMRNPPRPGWVKLRGRR